MSSIFAAPDHPLTKLTVLQLEDFHGQVFLTNEKGCPYRTMFDRQFEKKGIDSITYLEFQNAEAIKQWEEHGKFRTCTCIHRCYGIKTSDFHQSYYLS